MRNLYQLITALFIVSYFIPTAAAQQFPGYRSFKLEKDNRPVKINTLYKNRHGYLLAGTDNGLYKFDGEKYIKIDFENPDYNDTVTVIFEDRYLKTWIGFKNGRIANIVNNKLHYFDPEEGTPNKKITSFLSDSENNLWYATNGEGVYFIRNGRIYLINKEDGLSDLNVSALALAKNGDILAGTDQGINICNTRNGKKTVSSFGPRQGLPDYIVTCITTSHNNNFWIGLEDKGFCSYDHTNKNISVPPVSKEWKYGQVNALLEIKNSLWIATQDSGLFCYSILTGQLKKMFQATADKKINSLLDDNQGNIWYASYNEMVRTAGEILQLTAIPGAPVFEHIHAILCDKDGNFWLNDENNYLIRLSFLNDSVSVKKILLPGVNAKIDITSIYQDLYGNIWVGTIGRGLFVVDPLSLAHRVFDENPTFINAGILSISGKDNVVYVSGLQGSMHIDLTEENRSVSGSYHYSNYDGKSIGTNYIYSVYCDSKGRVWFATDGEGLVMLSGNGFTYFNKKDQVKDSHIYSITEDKFGNIWFSTATAGIYKFDGKRFTNYSIKEGLSDLNISVLKTDKAGNIIITHKKSLDILDPLTGNISYLSHNMGIPLINAEDLGAVTKDTSGNIMISTREGILTYAPPENAIRRPTVLIESIQLFLHDLADSSKHIFSYDENNFTFNYTGLYYSDPENIYYQYKLEGLDSSWVMTKDRSKNFPKLAPGKYRFRIQSCLNKNFKYADEASFSFEIRQAFYKTIWFAIIVTALICLLVYLYIRSREKALMKYERLRQENIQFQFEVLRNQVNPHFLFNSFNTLISTIEEEPKFAVEYAEQLSEFFRNVVNQRDKETISLKDEIDALYSYSFLQQKRYGSSLQVKIDIAEAQKIKYHIPPLSLQLLLENAIKHNAVSKETPLIITITVNEEEYLVMKNNINPMISKHTGAGMGLHNIINRYKLLSKKGVLVENDVKYFIVSLPLLK